MAFISMEKRLKFEGKKTICGTGNANKILLGNRGTSQMYSKETREHVPTERGPQR